MKYLLTLALTALALTAPMPVQDEPLPSPPTESIQQFKTAANEEIDLLESRL